MPSWTPDRFDEFVRNRLGKAKFIVVSNREPYSNSTEAGRIQWHTAAGGLTTALVPILRAVGGTWVAHASGPADRQTLDARDCVQVPPGDPCYTLRRVWIPAALLNQHYCGMCNEGLWPLCHVVFRRPRFIPSAWRSYEEVNRIFADAVLEQAGDGPAFVFVQDYHLGLLPRLLKERNPNLTVAHFWHIPWPHRDQFRVFPWKHELLDGLLGNDLLAFQTQDYCDNFLQIVDSADVFVNLEDASIARYGHVTKVLAVPISIDFDDCTRLAAGPEVAGAAAQWCHELGGTPDLLGIGIDRIDYTKGISERLKALDLLLRQHPEYVGRLTFVQIAVPSRTEIPEYRMLGNKLVREVDELNRRWRHGNWMPLRLLHRFMDQTSLSALHQMADFCLVTSLHDGMNLVAKEFVASRNDGDGVLVLSEFTGAAQELKDAIVVNPYSLTEVAHAIHSALTMSSIERRRRMAKMRSAVARHNIYSWAANVIQTLCRHTTVNGLASPAGLQDTARALWAANPA